MTDYEDSSKKWKYEAGLDALFLLSNPKFRDKLIKAMDYTQQCHPSGYRFKINE